MRSTHPSRISANSQRGFSLIELMISVLIGLILLAGMISIVVSSSRSNREINASARQMESGRYAVAVLTDDIRHAGFYGEQSQISSAVPGTLPDPCATSPATILGDMAVMMQGYDAPASPAGLVSCLDPANHLPGTDILVIRRASTALATGALSANEIYLQSNPLEVRLGMGDSADFTLTDKTGAAAPIRKFQVVIYFVSPCSIPDSGTGLCDANSDDGRPIPTLKRMELTDTGTGFGWVTTPLAEGIETLQLVYGIDTDGDGTPNDDDTSPALADWPNVASVTVNVLARNTEPTPGFIDQKKYDLGMDNTDYTPAESGYRRHVFTSVVRAMNVSGRRES